MRNMRSSLCYVFILSVIVVDPAAADIHKCVAEDGGVSYSDTPCPGSQTIGPSSATKGDSMYFSRRDADIAYECMGALRLMKQQIKDQADGVERYARRVFRREFNEYCPALGFRSPLGSETLDFNVRHAEKLKERLKFGGHSGPSFSRSYSGGSRMPALFSTVSRLPSENETRVDQWPRFRKGLWQIKAEEGPRSHVSEECMWPVDRLVDTVRGLERFGCEWSPIKRVPDGAVGHAKNCEGTTADGGKLEFDVSLHINVTSADAFTAEVKKGKGSRFLFARRISDCPERQHSDSVLPIGPRAARATSGR